MLYNTLSNTIQDSQSVASLKYKAFEAFYVISVYQYADGQCSSWSYIT